MLHVRIGTILGRWFGTCCAASEGVEGLRGFHQIHRTGINANIMDLLRYMYRDMHTCLFVDLLVDLYTVHTDLHSSEIRGHTSLANEDCILGP